MQHPHRINTQLSRRNFLHVTGVGLAGLAASSARAKQPGPTRPNVLLIMTDDQGYGDLSCHGNTVLSTPHLDRLHDQSVRLTDFHVSPTCAPTRAALMTGRYNNRTGVWHTIMGRSILRRDERTMADYFSDAGYRTGIFGKWHLGDNYPYRPEDRGFQEVLIHGGGGVGQTPDYWGNNYTDDTYFHNGQPTPYPGYCTNVWFDGARAFMEAKPDEPFFCYLATNISHAPYLVDESYRKPFLDQGVKPDRAAFYGMLTHFDECMGRLLARLDATGLSDNTIVIFMTDNGTSAGHRGGMRGAKGSEYEGGHRVPCFIRWPKGDLGGDRNIDQVTAHIDILPTLLDYCGIERDTTMPFDGISLRPWLTDENRVVPERTVVVDSQRIDHPKKWRKSAVLEKHWRLVNGKELYDVEKDPAQKKDIAQQHQDVVKRLRDQYDVWWASTSKHFDEYCPLVVGAADQGAMHFSCHDWHAPIAQVPWNQPHIREGKPGQGFWVIDVETAGTYTIALRRWPRETNGTIRGSVDGGKALPITTARVQIADVSETKPVSNTDRAVAFQVALSKGEHRLHTAFVEDDGSERGAYYISMERSRD
ncbi:MAG: arylsulfatase [Candidatus Hydrogenedentes bacterium]|nr:arylsulfatase [Candidatus Hydrogenedentota bacterium]